MADTHPQLSEQGQWRPERVFIHSYVSLPNGGQGGYSFTADCTGPREGTLSQLSKQAQWRPERYSFTAEGIGPMEAREVLIHS